MSVPALPKETRRLLTILPFDQLGPEEREEALRWSRALAVFEVTGCAGMKNHAGQPTYPETWLTKGYPLDFFRHVVEPARSDGVLSRQAAEEWWVHLRGNPELFDVRVREFLNAWESKGHEIVAGRKDA